MIHKTDNIFQIPINLVLIYLRKLIKYVSLSLHTCDKLLYMLFSKIKYTQDIIK